MTIDIYKKYPPLMSFFFPTGWFCFKNNFYDIEPKELIKIHKDEAFLVEDVFFGEDVFISRFEMPLTTTQFFMGMVSVGCRLFLDKVDESLSHCIYDITIYLYRVNGRKKEIFFECTNQVNDRVSATRMVSHYMHVISNYIYPDLKSAKIDFVDVNAGLFNSN